MRRRGLCALGVAAVVVAAVGTGAVAAEPRPRVEPKPACSRPSGVADWYRAPSSVSQLVEQSEAVVKVRVVGDEKLATTSGGNGTSTVFVMGSKARVEDVFKG